MLQQYFLICYISGCYSIERPVFLSDLKKILHICRELIRINSYNNNSNESENIENNKSDVVYWTKSGKKYHSDPNCSGMKSPISGTIKESQRTPCSKCY